MFVCLFGCLKLCSFCFIYPKLVSTQPLYILFPCLTSPDTVLLSQSVPSSLSILECLAYSPVPFIPVCCPCPFYPCMLSLSLLSLYAVLSLSPLSLYAAHFNQCFPKPFIPASLPFQPLHHVLYTPLCISLKL